MLVAVRRTDVAAQRGIFDQGTFTIDQLPDLASVLGLAPRALRQAIGSPWYRVPTPTLDSDRGDLFVGRDGPSAAVWCLGAPEEMWGDRGVRTWTSGRVVVGTAVASLRESGSVGWTLGRTRTSLELTAGIPPRMLLRALHTLVQRCVAERSAEVASCRRCQEPVCPELRGRDGLCHGCAPYALRTAG